MARAEGSYGSTKRRGSANEGTRRVRQRHVGRFPRGQHPPQSPRRARRASGFQPVRRVVGWIPDRRLLAAPPYLCGRERQPARRRRRGVGGRRVILRRTVAADPQCVVPNVPRVAALLASIGRCGRVPRRSQALQCNRACPLRLRGQLPGGSRHCSAPRRTSGSPSVLDGFRRRRCAGRQLRQASRAEPRVVSRRRGASAAASVVYREPRWAKPRDVDAVWRTGPGRDCVPRQCRAAAGQRGSALAAPVAAPCRRWLAAVALKPATDRHDSRSSAGEVSAHVGWFARLGRGWCGPFRSVCPPPPPWLNLPLRPRFAINCVTRSFSPASPSLRCTSSRESSRP